MYADKKRRRVCFGHVIEYDPERNLKDETDRIVLEATRQIRGMAEQGEE